MSLQQLRDPSLSSGASTIAWPGGFADRAAFWQYAEDAQDATADLAARKMQVLRQLPVPALREFCTQYRFFTIDYIRDLALLLAKLPFGGLRSLLSRILAEELGDGDAGKAHPELYDRFLGSIGVTPGALGRALPANRALLAALTDELAGEGPAFGVGLRGMGGECLCQTYLSVMFEHLRLHPYIRDNAERVDWEFWTIHTGEEDIIHGELTRQAIDEYLVDDPGALPDLARGYARSMGAWNQFWENIFDACLARAGRPS